MVKFRNWNFTIGMFPRIYTEKALLYLLAVKKRDYLALTADKKALCRIDFEPKKSGGVRKIYKPSYKLKWLLKRINKRYLSLVNFPNFVHCGPDKKSIVTAARGHDLYKYHLSLDIDSFFDSISERCLLHVLNSVGITKEISAFLVKSSIEDNQLPQGFPTSSLLSALVIAYLLQDFYAQMTGHTVLLSIYADDILISANDLETLKKGKAYIESKLNPQGLILKPGKELLVRNGQQFTWLGLQVYPWIALPRKNLLALEKKIYEFKVSGVIPEDFKPKKVPRNTEEKRTAYAASLKGKVDYAGSMNRNKIPAKAMKKLVML